MNLPFDEGLDLISEAVYQKTEEDLYLRWLVGKYEYKFSFDEFKRKVKAPARIKNISSAKPITKKDALAKVENLLDLNWRSV